MSEPLLTVDAAAQRLNVHVKTVLRFIRDGRLRATRIGKAYRIHRPDLDALVGAPPTPVAEPSVTSIVDIPASTPEQAREWTKAVTTMLAAKPQSAPPMRADIVHDPERSHLKIVLIGGPSETAAVLSNIHIWHEQLR